MDLFGGIEAGGTKFLCGVGTDPNDLSTVSFPTASPEETIAKAIQFLQKEAGGNLKAIGIASFGPIDLDRESKTYGYITSTPKIGWNNYDFVGTVANALRVPVGFDTDVNAAALSEAKWGAARDIDDFLYLTVGTGIGGGALIGGKLIHGLTHPEMGHIRLPHDLDIDPFPGICPFHKDCLEGLASGLAIQERWGMPAFRLPNDHPAWELESRYLALALANWICTLSPRRIVMGGGVMERGFLFPMIRRELQSLLNGYIRATELGGEGLVSYVVPPELRNHSGLLGGILLAQQACS